MTVRVPALPDEPCPKCGASNPNDVQVSVWRVANEQGAGFECDVCAHTWRHQHAYHRDAVVARAGDLP